MNTKKKYIEWDDKYLVNVPGLDEAHFNLFSLVNNLHVLGSVEELDQKELKRCFHNFLEYVYSHFTEEEAYMEGKSYKGFREHKQHHDHIRSQFEKYFDELKDGKLDLENFLSFTRDWLTSHIVTEDQKYVSVKS